MERHVTGRTINLTHTFYADEDETTIVPGAVTVTITASGSTTPAQTGAANYTGGVWTYAAAPLDEGTYAVLWDGGTGAQDTAYMEVAGGRVYQLARARVVDVDLTISRFPTADLAAARAAVEDEFERITGRSFIPVTRRFRIELTGSTQTTYGGSSIANASTPDAVWLGRFDMRSLVALSGPLGAVDVTTVSLDENGVLSGLSALQGGVYYATVAYGLTAVPGDIERAAILRTRDLLTRERGGIPDRATSFSAAEGGTYTLATPGLGKWRTGIPDVDSVLMGYSYDIATAILGALG